MKGFKHFSKLNVLIPSVTWSVVWYVTYLHTIPHIWCQILCSGISVMVLFAAVIGLIFPSALHSCPIVYFSPFIQIYSGTASGGTLEAWLQYVSWTNKGFISLQETMSLTKCSICGQQINTPSVIFEFHICIRLDFHNEWLSSTSPWGTLQYARRSIVLQADCSVLIYSGFVPCKWMWLSQQKTMKFILFDLKSRNSWD